MAAANDYSDIVFKNERGACVTTDWVNTYAPGINVDPKKLTNLNNY